ncbi:hypothetical protein GCK72_006754 [Caenorhabditis remanei]|uniref:K Homology domain-containing protein n=1 Tax=Caenorhabditis remanei TaxID=31234 RepID=A0A6A5HJE1_CAERE|nr:hypothetical protein GCK72_006754 [Caenorhabditis remanei]KAF1766796.1 hypothetical protein GCK72_006754 [Caenorhabditis remanei]
MSYFEQRSSAKRAHDDYSDGSDESPKRWKQYSYPQGIEKQNAVIRIEHPIPENCAGLVIGRNGTEIMSISQISQCQLQVIVDLPINGYRMVEIVGTPENVECAKKCIDETISRAAVNRYSTDSSHSNISNYKITIPIPANKCGLVIGKGGETMRNLRALSNCFMLLSQDHNLANNTKSLMITGDQKAVEYAKKLVADVIANEYDSPATMVGNGSLATMSLLVKVPRSSVGKIIGVKGQSIKKIMDETKTKIQFMPDDDPSLMERSLMLMGKTSSVTVAAHLLKEIVDSTNPLKNTSVAVFYMSIPTSKVGLVIGRGGEVIKQINAESGAHCELSRETGKDPHEKTFVIRGSDVQVEHAKHLICMKVGDIPPNTPFVPRTAQQPQVQMQQPYPLQHQYQYPMQYQQPMSIRSDLPQYLQPHFPPVCTQQNYSTLYNQPSALWHSQM